jgi:hypothetical protein
VEESGVKWRKLDMGFDRVDMPVYCGLIACVLCV